jgi:hypothetical protein
MAQIPLAYVDGTVDEEGSKPLKSPRPVTPEAIVNAFITAETRVREALNQYTFKRDVVLQTIGANGAVTGEYIRNSQFLFDDKGKRIERVLYRPASTLRGMRITKEDIQDLEGAQLLGIDVTEAGKYRFEYVGAENDNPGQLLAINVTPVKPPDPHRMHERYFVGRIWIDANTLQVVKVQGRVEPQGKQRFPVFETRREAAGEFFFPTLTKADDILRFRKYDVHYRVQARYYDYQRFASKLTITEIEAPPE